MSKEKITIRRAPRDGQHPYMQLLRKIPQDLSLSFEEIGLLVYMLSLPNDSEIDMKNIGEKRELSPKNIEDMMNNLEKFGYIENVFLENGNNQFALSGGCYE